MEPTILGPEFYEKKRKAALQRAKEDAIYSYRRSIKKGLWYFSPPKNRKRDSYIVKKLLDDFISHLPDTQNPKDFEDVLDRFTLNDCQIFRKACREVRALTKKELEERTKDIEDLDHDRDERRAAHSLRSQAEIVDMIEDKIIDAMRRKQVQPGSEQEAYIFHKLRKDLVAEFGNSKYRNGFWVKTAPARMDDMVSDTLAELSTSCTEPNAL